MKKLLLLILLSSCTSYPEINNNLTNLGIEAQKYMKILRRKKMEQANRNQEQAIRTNQAIRSAANMFEEANQKLLDKNIRLLVSKLERIL